MDRMIYTALSGMEAAMTRQRVTASNLANAQTTGFRAEVFTVDAAELRGPSLEARAMNRGGVRAADMNRGELAQTGQPLDVALDGDALLALQAADGSEVYSRRGDLSVAASGVLQNGDGLPVMGASGPITVPPGRALSIGADGNIFAADLAAPDAPAQNVGRIKLASPQGTRIAKDVEGFFRVVGGGILPANEAATLTSGALEQSNVDTTKVLVDMIEAQRAFERRAKLFSTAGEIDTSGAKLMSLRS